MRVVQLFPALIVFLQLHLTRSAAGSVSCRSCMRVIERDDPIIREYSITSEKLVPEETACQEEACSGDELDICLHIVLDLNPNTTVHVHNCGVSTFSNGHICELLKYGAKAGANTDCTVNRCSQGDCEDPQNQLINGTGEEEEEELIINNTESLLQNATNAKRGKTVSENSSAARCNLSCFPAVFTALLFRYLFVF